MIDRASVAEIRQRDVYDVDGSRIGEASDVYLDDDTGLPEWVTVKTGLFGTKETFVPLRDAELTTEGLRVPVAKDVAKDAPRIDPDGRLSPAEERELYRHYGIERDVVGGVAGEESELRTVTEPAHPVDAEHRGTAGTPRHEAGDEPATSQDQVSGPLDPPEAQRNVAASAEEKPLLRRYGN
ncbi:PRC-barrel domain-containing protein [Blastococcus montanus]|uniref:PRC-barrel domain-containing protein n=1 Tax=Blastococcus montanus TaxID=3144973 RepID=UPI00320B8F5F